MEEISKGSIVWGWNGRPNYGALGIYKGTDSKGHILQVTPGGITFQYENVQLHKNVNTSVEENLKKGSIVWAWDKEFEYADLCVYENMDEAGWHRAFHFSNREDTYKNVKLYKEGMKMDDLKAKVIDLLTGTQINDTINNTISDFNKRISFLELALNKFNENKNLNSLEKLERALQKISCDSESDLNKLNKFVSNLSDSIYDFKESICYEIKNVVEKLNIKEE